MQSYVQVILIHTVTYLKKLYEALTGKLGAYTKPLLFALGFGIIGLVPILVTRAAMPTVSLEVESGVRTANSALVTDGTASSGSAVKFTDTTSPTDPSSGVTHGQQINTTNTGYLAWRGTSGQTCTDAQLTVYNTRVDASSLGSSATCVWLKSGINIDANITLNACRVDTAVSTYPQNKKLTLNYCTINPTTPADWSLGDGNFTATRCQILGSSDGVRYSGSSTDTLIENYIRVKLQSADDHNDGVQMYGATGGGEILRNNIDARPVGSNDPGNAAVFIADGATGTYEIRDNYLSGGNSSLRLHESGYYRVTGNIIEKGSYSVSPVNTTMAISGAFLEWSNNKLSDGTIVNP